MVRRAIHFTPQVLLGAPRRSAGVPNPAGSKVVYTVSTYNFEAHKKTNELRVLDVQSGDSLELARDKDIADLNWLDDEHLVYFEANKDGSTGLVWRDIGVAKDGTEGIQAVGAVDAPCSNLKVAKLDAGKFGIAFSAQAGKDGKPFNPEKAPKLQSTGKLYKKLFVRHWDKYETKERNALFYTTLSTDDDGKWHLGQIYNALKDTKLESPVEPFGGTDNFDVSKAGIVFVSKDPVLNVALNTKCNTYVAKLPSWEDPPAATFEVEVPEACQGAATAPIFRPDGRAIAFLKMEENGYESDKTHILIAEYDSLDEAPKARYLLSKPWDRSPASISFTTDSKHMLAIAEDHGAVKLFSMSSLKSFAMPQGSFSDLRCLKSGAIFLSGSSLVDNSFYAILQGSLAPDAVDAAEIRLLHSNTHQGDKLGLSAQQIDSIWTPASNPKINEKVHAWVMRPSHFDPKKKYPIAYLIHGGPQGAWGNSWSTRWNPAIFAEQGYVVVAPNITGSTGYGQAFVDAVSENWGGDPYQDIINLFDWVEKNMPEADNDRAVMLGASYGGFMANWIQGHDLGRKFKAIVCHDGIFSTVNLLSTEELWFLHDVGGPPWQHTASLDGDDAAAQVRKNFGKGDTSSWVKWDPSRHLDNWSTPQLVIHSSKDYRLPISEGLAAFNVLQARGVESQFLTFPDENHWVLKPENSLLWHKVVLNWINKHAGLPAFARDDEEDDEFYGGTKAENEKEQGGETMPSDGHPAT
ncbi:alpha/beta-hydrolase [Polychaeton citri CBS 116435]|uniref:Dipeptidyl-peptidase V n=1 Tax=Polychaeton citri CBS 116435 TaxID=1314669 RepID=A0A9P4Q7N2_9PEZI|nr:alpha/beta-hydrolase [Polychaeton citri CBS 116435]